MSKDAYLDYLDYRGVSYTVDNVPQDYVSDYLKRWQDDSYDSWQQGRDLVQSVHI